MSETGYALPGGANTYIPNTQATENLLINYSRNAKDFPLAKWAQYKKVKKTNGQFIRVNAEEAARIVNQDLSDFVWPDGADDNQRNETEGFKFELYHTERYAYRWRLGAKAVDEAEFPVLNLHSLVKAQQAMTGRVTLACKVLQTEGLWDADHVIDVTSFETNSGSWEDSTTSTNNIRRSIFGGVEIINGATLGQVKIGDLHLVMNPNTARRVGASQEILDFVKQQAGSPGWVTGSSDELLEQYGLPKKLHGLNVEVENTIRITNTRGATKARTYPLEDGNVFILARPGELVAPAGNGPSFSTLMIFLLEEMTVETKRDPDARREVGRIVDDFEARLVAPASGIWFQNVLTEDSSS